MKKFFTLLFSLLTFGWTTSNAQNNCTVTASNVKAAVTSTQTSGGNCESTINVTFDLLLNGGFKWAFLYFYDGLPPFTPNGYTPSSTDSKLPGAFVLLDGTAKNEIFVPSSQNVNGIASRTGYSVSQTTIAGGFRFSITGLLFTKPGACTTSEINLYVGGTNQAQPAIQCYNNPFAVVKAYRLAVNGSINCGNTRSYNLILETDYKNNLGSDASLTGVYDVFVDENRNSLIDAGETQITSVASFGTNASTSPNRFTSFNNVYNFPVGDPRTSAPLLVRVTPNVGNVAPVVGRLANGCGILPVSMKSFNVKKQAGKVSLTWETADESNNKGFEVQRRLNNGQYETVAFVPAKAINGGGATYSYDDQSLLPDGSIYYRLRQVDNDEQSRYSDIRMIHNNTKKLNVSVYPNPSNGAATLILPEAAGSMDITIEDYTGRTVQRWTSYNSNNLQINQLRPGIYMIRVQSKESGEQTVQRLMVQ